MTFIKGCKPGPGRPRHIPTQREFFEAEAKAARRAEVKAANRLLRFRNLRIYVLRERGEKWEVICSMFNISLGRGYQIWKAIQVEQEKS